MPEHTVHWVGTGLSTGSGLRMLVERGAPVTLWGRTEEKAQACARRLGLTGRVATTGYQRSPLADHVAEGDVVVSMLPVRPDGGAEWSGRYLLDLVGGDHETAMARCVSLPLAYGVSRIRDGALTPGLHRAADDAAESDRWIAFLRDQGVL
jgi:hypothetical protein